MGLMSLYYAYLIFSDLAAAKAAKAESEREKEVPVDVSDQLGQYEPFVVGGFGGDSSPVSKETAIIGACMAMSAEEMHRTIADVFNGRENERAKNLYYKLDKAVGRDNHTEE